MRFRTLIGIIFLLTFEHSNGTFQAACEISWRNFVWNGQSHALKTCTPIVSNIDDVDFTISSETNFTALNIRNEEGVKFLPSNLPSFVDLLAILINNCSVTSVNGNHLQNLSKLECLYLTQNKIDFIAANAFDNLTELIELVLGFNSIQSLGENTFASLRMLKMLGLHENKIQFLHPKTFKSLVRVEALYLNSNEITSLDEDIFENLISIRNMSLYDNKLSRVSKKLFKKNPNLEWIWLQNNKIVSIEANMFNHLSKLIYVDLRDNVCLANFYYAQNFDAMRRDLRKLCGDVCGVPKNQLGLIVFGQSYQHGSFPWTVALMNIKTRTPSFFCGGTLISKTFVVTAAHCILKKGAINQTSPQDILALFGAHDLNIGVEPGRISQKPKQIFIHDDWNHNAPSYDGDIALLEFGEGKIQFSVYIQPICLWDVNDEPVVTAGEVTGWGKSEKVGKDHENLPTLVSAPIQSNEECFLSEKKLAGLSSLRTFCAGLKNGSGVCNGDSGGGFFVKIGSIYHLKGIVSSSLTDDGRCDVFKNAIYTNVMKFRDWIDKIAGNTLAAKSQDLDVLCTFNSSNRTPNTCYVDKNINREDFVFASPTNSAIEHFHVQNKESKFLPSRIGEKLPNLKVFWGASCQLTVIRNHYFKNMQKLQLLYLFGNQIVTIEPNAFNDLVGLDFLMLYDNKIETLDEKLFSKMLKLRQLLLKDNKIKFLSPTTFKIVGGKLETVALWRNVCVDKWYGPNPWDKEVYGMEELSELEANLRVYCSRKKRFS